MGGITCCSSDVNDFYKLLSSSNTKVISIDLRPEVSSELTIKLIKDTQQSLIIAKNTLLTSKTFSPRLKSRQGKLTNKIITSNRRINCRQEIRILAWVLFLLSELESCSEAVPS